MVAPFTRFVTSIGENLAESAPFIVVGFVVAGVVHEFIPHGLMKRHLGAAGVAPIVKAIGLGSLLPLCSCSTIPLGFGLARSGAGQGTVLAFLAAAPTLSPVALILGATLLGLPMMGTFALIVVAAALVLGLAGNRYLPKTAEQTPPRKDSCTCHGSAHSHDHGSPSSGDQGDRRCAVGRRLQNAVHTGIGEIGAETTAALLAGLGLASAISAFVPEEALAAWLGKPTALAFGAAIALALPAYTCMAPSLLVAHSFILKGVNPGVAVAFLIAGPATNLGELLALRRGMGSRVALLYASGLVGAALIGGIAVDLATARGIVAVHVHGRDAAPTFADHGHAHSHSSNEEGAPRLVAEAWRWPFMAVLVGMGLLAFRRGESSSRRRNASSDCHHPKHGQLSIAGSAERLT